MKKRLLALLTGLVCVALAAGCTSSSGSPASGGAAASGARPNFVFVLTDDLAWNLVSHMPQVAALQRAGTTMSHYYVVDSLCCPSRSAIFTGEYPHDDGVYTNAGSDGGYNAYNQHGDPPRSFAVALQKAGVPAGRVASQLTSNIDLCPTFETLAGVPVPPAVDGHSLAGLWHGQDPPDWRQAVLIEHHGPDDTPGDPDRQGKASADPPSYEAVRTATALYVRYSHGEQEYYNTANDPDELDNIAGTGIPAALPRALAAMQNCHTGATCWTASHLRPGSG